MSESEMQIEPVAPASRSPEELYLGDAIHFFLSAKRAVADSSRKNHLAVLRSFFQTLSRRLEIPDPTRTLDEVRFHSGAPKRSYLTKREAEILLSSMDKQATNVSSEGEENLGVREAS